LEHLLLKCERLKCIFKLLGSWFRKFDENFSEKVNQIYIFKKEKKSVFLGSGNVENTGKIKVYNWQL